jgi:hypothetical protein
VANNMPPEYSDYVKKLESFGHDALPAVVAEAINATATTAHIQSIRNARERMTMRNQYTERSIRYYKANTKTNIAKINAVTGSISDYMDEQEAGGKRYPKQGSKAPIATLAARGGSSTRVVRKQYRAGSLGEKQFVGVPRGGNRPLGVYERRNKNTRLIMIRNLSLPYIDIKPTHWHTDAVSAMNQSRMQEAFIREAERELAKLGAK